MFGVQKTEFISSSVKHPILMHRIPEGLFNFKFSPEMAVVPELLDCFTFIIFDRRWVTPSAPDS